jgi:hypothetical protein
MFLETKTKIDRITINVPPDFDFENNFENHEILLKIRIKRQ